MSRYKAGFMDEIISRGIDTSAWDQTISSLRKEGKRVLLFTEDDRIIGVIAAIRPLIPGAHEAVRALKRMDIDICLLTDGSQDESDLLSKNLRLENVIYQPARYEVERLLQNLSDSNNVSAYLSSDPERIASLPADVTAVIGTGANTSYEHAGLQLTRKRLGDFVHAVELSRNLNSRIQNAQMAVILYHAAAVSLFGFLLPQFLPLRLPLAVPLICSLAAIYLASRFR
jgi:cation transport ATPase